MTRLKWKGKGRALDVDVVSEVDYSENPRSRRRDVGTQEGSGEASGIVLPLDMVGGGIYDVAYTLPVKFGSKSQQFSLQVDTGSSDLWVASTSCSTSSCKATQGRLYDPSGSRPTGQDFSIPYLSGSAAGPIVWDKVTIGGYSIDNQALAAATDVQNEPLSPKFSGILGLALPLNSIIASTIPPVTNNDPDGAAWASNLFSITPTSLAPSSRFLSLSLARPGSDRVPSLLGIGMHPSSLVPDPSQVRYSTLVGDRSGVLFWKVGVRAITVYVGGVSKSVDVGRSNTGAVFPSAVVDSGVPYILTTTTVANAIYGAIGISPGKDGMYYVPCTTPLNLTFTIDDRPEISIHPLDLTAEPADDNQASFCVGLIQTADAQLSTHDSTIGDMILGVPFLRNVYTVMAYTTPNADGTFPSLGSGNGTDGGLARVIRPKLGLMGITDPTVALQEFNTVRVLNQPISSSNGSSSGASGSNTGSDTNTKTVDVGGTKLSVGIIVLIGLLSFFGVCVALFGVRWCVMRRKYGRSSAKGAQQDEMLNGMSLDQKAAFTLVRSGMAGSFAKRGDDGVDTGLGLGMTEEELRGMRYQAYLRKEKLGLSLAGSESTVDSDFTLARGGAGGVGDEFGRIRRRRDMEEGLDDTLVVRTDIPRPRKYSGDAEDDEDVPDADTPLVGNTDNPNLHQTHSSFYTDADSPPSPSPHKNMPSVDQPLLLSSHQYNSSGEYVPRHYTLDDTQPHHDLETDDLGELGFVNGVSMAGVGSASRTSKLSSLSSVASRYSVASADGQGEGQEVVHAIRESGVLNSPVGGVTRTPVAAIFPSSSSQLGSVGSASAAASARPVNFSLPLRSQRSQDDIPPS